MGRNSVNVNSSYITSSSLHFIYYIRELWGSRDGLVESETWVRKALCDCWSSIIYFLTCQKVFVYIFTTLVGIYVYDVEN